MMKKINLICNYLDELYEDPKTELNFNKDYELLISVVLSAQTTDIMVNKVTSVLFSKYNTLNKLNSASLEDIESIVKKIGLYKKKSLAIKEITRILINDYNGVVPNKKEDLIKMPLVGNKTANVVLSVLYDQSYIAVDTHVNRVSKRLGIVKEGASVLDVEKTLEKILDPNNYKKRHLQLILFGRYKCKSRKPECLSCKLINICEYEKKEV